MNKKKIIIIGAGIAGMSAGIYALDNDFDVEIYEKHSIVGGQCTGWDRKGAYIDGCAHWIVGTNPKSDFYPMWKHVGAFNDETLIHETEYFTKFDIDGQIFTLYSDLDKLYEELINISPIDKKMIKHFIKAIKAYHRIKVPIHKPVDHMNLFELTKFGLTMLPVLPYLLPAMHKSVRDYRNKFKSPIIREMFDRVIDENYNIHSLFYIMRSLSRYDAGMVSGGSRMMAFNIRDNYLVRGGKIFSNMEIDHIYIKDNVSKGIVLKNGEVIYADYVVAATDAHHTIFDLLQGKYKDKYYMSRFDNQKDNPLNQGIQVSFKINKNIKEFPKMLNFKIPNIKIGYDEINNFTLRNHAFDEVLYQDDSSVLTVLIGVTDETYKYLKSLTKEEYKNEKKRFGTIIREEIIKYLKLEEQEIILIDVTTPLTYERYTNAYHGSYMSFLTTKKVKGLMRVGLIKGLDNFVLAGQWIMPPGGLPIALFSGKYAIRRICKMEKRKFNEFDFSK